MIHLERLFYLLAMLFIVAGYGMLIYCAALGMH